MESVSRRQIDDIELVIYAADVDGADSNTNVDVEVIDKDGRRWAATFFTIENVEAQFAKNAVTGECARGTYFWASEMILTRALSISIIETVVRDLRAAGEFPSAFRLLEDG